MDASPTVQQSVVQPAAVTTPAAQVPAAQAPAAEAPRAPARGAAGDEPQASQGGIDAILGQAPEPLREYVGSLKRELIERRQRAHTLEDQLRAATAKLSEHEEARLKEQGQLKEALDQAHARVEAVESQYRERILRMALAVEFAAQGGIDPEDAHLIPTDGIKVQKDGSFAGVREAVQALRERKPYLFRTGAAAATGHPAPAAPPAAPRPSGTAEPVDVRALDRRDYEQWWRDQQAALRRRR